MWSVLIHVHGDRQKVLDGLQKTLIETTPKTDAQVAQIDPADFATA